MKFSGYRYKFKFNASHAMKTEQGYGDNHQHTFEIILYVKVNVGELLDYNHFEDMVNGVIDQYRGKFLNSIPPFDEMNTTLENMGDVLFRQIVNASDKNLLLTKMEISENLTRNYIIDQRILQDKENQQKNKINSNKIKKIMLNDLKQIAAHQILSGSYDKQDSEDKDKQPPSDCTCNIPNCTSETTDKRHILMAEPTTVNTQKIPVCVQLVFAILAIGAASFIFIVYLYRQGSYPWGSDTLGHIFRADMLYKDIRQGNILPLYTDLWYNGTQPFRYWGPATYYILAAFEFLTAGNAIHAFMLFTAALFFAGCCGWLLWGIRMKRVFLAVTLGILFFCLPDNLRVFFSEGNVPRAIITTLFPYLFYFIFCFVEEHKKNAIVCVIFLMMIMIFCHLMIAAMVGVTVVIFLIIYVLLNKKYKAAVEIVFALLTALLLCGIWVYPALKGGLLSIDSSVMFNDVMSSMASSFSFSQTLNPILRTQNIELYYFGFSIALITVLGIFLSKKDSIPGFCTTLILLTGTNAVLFPIFSKLPMNQLFWMFRYTPLAYGVFIIAILKWKSLKRPILFLFVLLLAFDSYFSFVPLVHVVSPSKEVTSDLNFAKKITNQRIALLDDSEFGSFWPYYIGSEGKIVSNAFGWASQGATTFTNIVLLNTALETKNYLYMFDRSLELGCDTVIVKKDKVPKKDVQNLMLVGSKLHYALAKTTNLVYIYHRITPKKFGTVTGYENLAIGHTASNMTLQFPSFEQGFSDNIQDYSYKELSSFKTIYLSEFKYYDRRAAEGLLNRLAKNNVKIIIDMNNIPVDPLTNRMTFLNVTAESVTFNNQFPDMIFSGQIYRSMPLKDDNRIWNTVYLDNIQTAAGYSWVNNHKYMFCGQTGNPNITFLGFNLIYLAMVNHDNTVIDMLSKAMEVKADQLPERKIVPVEIEIKQNKLKIQSQYSNVNTTLAYLDAFKSKQQIENNQNLLYVNKGTTQITVEYPYFVAGLIISAIGAAAVILLVLLIYSNRIRDDKS